MTVGFGIIGFLDDYIKIIMKRSGRLKSDPETDRSVYHYRYFAWYLLHSGEVGIDMLIPLQAVLKMVNSYPLVFYLYQLCFYHSWYR